MALGMNPARVFACLLSGVLVGALCAVISFAAAGAAFGPHGGYHSRRDLASRAMAVHLARSPAIIDISADGFARGSIPFERILALLPDERIVAVDGVAIPGHFLDVQIAGHGDRRALVLVHR